MPFVRQRPDLHLTSKVYDELVRISKSRTEKASRIERAKMLLLYHDGVSISAIARELSTNRPKVERCVDKALQLGALSALDDLPRPGRPPTITPEAKTWVINLACKKPKELGYSFELWTHRLLAEYIRNHCIEAGYPCLRRISRGTISKILQKSNIRPHKIRYYVERRDPEFDQKMVQVLHVYKEVELIRENHKEEPSVTVPVKRRSVITLILYGELSRHVLRENAEMVRDQLLQDQSISQVELLGARPLEISIDISLDTLRSYNLTLQDIGNRIRRASLDLPGGTIKAPGG